MSKELDNAVISIKAVIIWLRNGCDVTDSIKELELTLANLQAAKPEQAQTAVGLPEPTPQQVADALNAFFALDADYGTKMAAALRTYATAKTAEAVALYQEQVRELVEEIEKLPAAYRVFFQPILAKYADKGQ